MMERISSHPVYYYVSTRAGCDPCRTIYVCAPGKLAGTVEAAEEFAVCSGWQRLAEESAAVLVLPVVPEGWKKESEDLLKKLYLETRNRFSTRSGQAIWGRSGKLWCWETVLYLAGYEDGAVYAGNVLAAHPNMFAAAALVNGAPAEYPAGERLSDHWLVPGLGTEYRVKNREIPVHLWMFQKDGTKALPALEYFNSCLGSYITTETDACGRMGQAFVSVQNPACQTRVFYGDFHPEDFELNQTILAECFEHVIRWKNGPDGTLALVESKKEFYEDPRFLRRRVTVGEEEYDYFVHLPLGRKKEELAGLPLVFTVHGRGEPAWMFTTKNGWDTLADETGEFILVSPDSPGNIWFLSRDAGLFPRIVEEMAEEFQIDRQRVYLTGFSNGGMMVREAAVSYPQLFAACSPWNAPVGNTSAMRKEDSNAMAPEFDPEFTGILETFLKSGYEMPCAFFFGDRDGAASAEKDLMIRPMLAANGCIQRDGPRQEDFCSACREYSPGKGYTDGNRFSKASFPSRDGETRVTVTVMKNMPHGAVYDESRATWDFLKRFRRVGGQRRVEAVFPA